SCRTLVGFPGASARILISAPRSTIQVQPVRSPGRAVLDAAAHEVGLKTGLPFFGTDQRLRGSVVQSGSPSWLIRISCPEQAGPFAHRLAGLSYLNEQRKSRFGYGVLHIPTLIRIQNAQGHYAAEGNTRHRDDLPIVHKHCLYIHLEA